MKKFLKTVPFGIATALIALSANAHAQTVTVNGLGSSALFLEAGLGAHNTSGPINASCVWSGNNNPNAGPSNVVTAADTSVSPAATDSGNAWVAWTTGSGGTCDAPASDAKVYAYLQTDSVVGNRCLFNANLANQLCKVTYPTALTAIAPAGLILGVSGEHNLPASISNALNASVVNVAGTDIRPEDAWFATKRALAQCGTPVVSGSQYLGLGYTNGANVTSSFSSSVFHVIDFSLPSAPTVGYSVTAVGATPILVVVNGQSTTSGFGTRTFKNITSANLALFLNGTSTKTDQVTNPSATTGNAVTTLIREPLSGTFNTMEYNVPNRTAAGFQTSQETGNCPVANPLTGSRKRAIGTGQELSQVIAAANGDVLGYGFWSVANFAGFTSTAAPNARYLTVDGIDPLITTSANHTGIIPLSGSSALPTVTLNNINNTNANLNYPIWSLLRFVSFGTTTPAAVTDLATATQGFVSFGTTTSRPDFIIASNMAVVRSHFVPPVPSTQPTPAADGHVGFVTSLCTNAEVGGDVGGAIFSLTTDSATCRSQAAGNKVGHTGQRR